MVAEDGKAADPRPLGAAPCPAYPLLEHLGAEAWVAQAAFQGGGLYHAILAGHQVALKALRAALGMGQHLPFPDSGQRGRPHYPGGPGHDYVGQIEGVAYRSRLAGDRERGLYALGVWADQRDLLEKAGQFCLVCPGSAPLPLPGHDPAGPVRPLPLPPPQVLARFLAWLDEAVLVPFRPEWGGRLWQKGSRAPRWSPLVSPAGSFGCAAWVVRADEGCWEEVVREILRED